MRFLLNWSIKLSMAGVLYVAVSTGASMKLPDTILGFKVSQATQQSANSNSEMAALGDKTTNGFSNVTVAFDK